MYMNMYIGKQAHYELQRRNECNKMNEALGCAPSINILNFNESNSKRKFIAMVVGIYFLKGSQLVREWGPIQVEHGVHLKTDKKSVVMP